MDEEHTSKTGMKFVFYVIYLMVSLHNSRLIFYVLEL